MATLDLGKLGLEIGVETSDLQKGLSDAKRRVTDFEKQLDRAGKKKLTPLVDVRHITKLDSQLGKVEQSASKLSSRKVTPGVDTRQVEKLSAELNKADKAADALSVPGGFEPALGGSASKARELADALKNVSGGGVVGQLGAVGGAVKGLLPHITAATVATTALTKGWSRLTAIEGAQATLTGLGNSVADVSAIMEDANAAVKGTAFGLGDAAKTASAAVAAGVKPGRELEQVLTTVADTAAITGDNISDMGVIFNSVLSRGALKGDDLMQLQSRGLPVLQLVADQMGVTAQEASKMATEGQISFQMFEEALRNRVGGAAQSAGETVKGSLANVGAAVGRLGATVQGPLFSALPAGLSAVTAAIDGVNTAVTPVVETLSSGAEAAASAWGALPGPVKTVTASIAAARVALALLNTEMGKAAATRVTGALATAKVGMSTFRAEVAATSAQLRAANPGMSMLGANMRAVATNAGIATGAMGLLRSTTSGLLALVGGPIGLAVMGLGAAIGGLISIFQKHRQAARDAEEAVKGWADTLAESNGKVDETVQQQALAAVQAKELSAQFEKTGHSAAELAHAMTNEQAYKELIADLDAQREALGHVSTADLNAKSDKYQLAQAIGEERQAIEELRGQYTEGAEQARENATASQQLADMTEKAADAAGNATPRYEQLNDTFAGVRDEAKGVDDAISKLADRMNTLSEDPAVRLQGYVDQMHKAMSELGKTITTDLPALNLETGVWEQGTEATIKANAEMRDFAETLNETAAAQYELNREQGMGHVEAADAARDSVRGFTDDMRASLEAAGRSQEEIDALIDTYASVPDEVFTQLSVAGLETADELSKRVQFNLAEISDDSTTLTVDSSALDITAEEAEKLGFTLEEIEGTRNVKLTADSESAQAALAELQGRADTIGLGVDVEARAHTQQAARALDELKTFTAYYDDNPANLGVVADTQEARVALDAMKVEYREMDGKLYIQHNTDEVQSALNEVGSRVDGLPEGYITIDKKEADEAKQTLDALGIETAELPDGELLVTTNAGDVRSTLEDVARWTEAFGDEEQVLKFLADTSEFDMDADLVAERINELDRSGATPVTSLDIQEYLDKDQSVRDALLDLSAERGIPLADLDPKQFDGKRDRVNRDLDALNRYTATSKVDADDSPARSVIDGFKRWAARRLATPITAVVNAVRGNYAGGVVGLETGGIPALAGGIPALAGGGATYGKPGGGYILPTTGPGTDTVDGIMGVDRAGQPTAMVNRGEFVVNDKRTTEFEPTLWALNRGDPAEAMRTLATHLPGMDVGALPGYADGGVVSPAELLAFANGRTVQGKSAPGSLEGSNYVWGGGLLGNWGDCSGAMSGLAAMAVGMPLQGRKFATGNQGSVLSSMGFSNGMGSGPRFAVGWFNGGPYGGHTSGSIFDADGNRTNVEMGGGRGNGQIGGRAAGADHPQYTNRAYIPLVGGSAGAVFDNGEVVSTSTEGVTFQQAGKTRKVDWGTASSLANDVQERTHRNAALARYNAGVYDTGGILRDGQIAVNTSGHDEYVIPPALTNAIVTYLPQYADALPGVTKALNDFTTMGTRVAESGFDRGALMQVGWETTQQAKMDLQNMPTDSTEFDKWAVYANRTAGEALMGAATMTNSQWIDAGEKLGLSFLGEYAGGIVRAQEEIEDSYVTQVDAADALTEAQSNLAEAQRELNEAMDGAPELSKSTARKIEDAEAKVAEARKGGDSKKLADAEKKLARVREDATEELEKNGAKDAQAILQAREAVTQAETDLTTAQGVVKQAAAATGQAHIAMALEVASTVIKVGKRVYEAVKKIVEFERAARIGAAEAHAQSMANMRDLTAAVETQRNVVGNLTAEMVRMKTQVLDSSWKVRQAQDSVWTAHLEGLVGVRKAEADLQAERDKLNGKQRYNFVGLDTEYDKLIGNVHAGLAGVDGAQADLLDTSMDTMVARIRGEQEVDAQARLTTLSRIAGEEGVEGAAWDAVMERMAAEGDVSDAAWAETLERIAAEEGVGGAAFEMMLARVKHEQQFSKTYGELMAERLQKTKGLNDQETELVRQVFDGKFKDYNDEKASIEERREFADAYYAMQKAGMEGVMEQATKSSAELQALHALRSAAEWEREKNVFAAQIASIDATREQQEAVKKLTRLGRDFNQEIANYNRMVSGTMGMQSDEAILLAEIARIEAENEKARADMKSAEARWGRAFDWDGDGDTLGINNRGSQKMQAARATIDANEKLLEQLNDRLEKIGGSGFELTAEDRHNLKIAGRLMANGENERAEGLIRATTMGRAQDVQKLNDIDKQLQEIKDERQDTYDAIVDARDEYRHMSRRMPLDMRRYHAEGMEASYRSDAEGYREADAATRGAWWNLANWQRDYAGNALDLSARNPMSMMMGLNIRNAVAGARNNTLIRMDLTKGALMHSDDVEAAFKRLESEMDGVKIDVRQLQRAGAPTGKTVQLQRAGIRR